MSADAAIGALADIAWQRRQHTALSQAGATPLLPFILDRRAEPKRPQGAAWLRADTAARMRYRSVTGTSLFT